MFLGKFCPPGQIYPNITDRNQNRIAKSLILSIIHFGLLIMVDQKDLTSLNTNSFSTPQSILKNNRFHDVRT